MIKKIKFIIKQFIIIFFGVLFTFIGALAYMYFFLWLASDNFISTRF